MSSEIPRPEHAGTIHHLQSERFAQLHIAALENVELRGALARGTSQVRNRRDAAVAKVDDWEELRDRAQALKTEVLRDLAGHLESFERQATASGMTVHWAP